MSNKKDATKERTSGTNKTEAQSRTEDIRIVSAKFRGKRNFKYPQIAAPRTPQEHKFNAAVLKIVRQDLAGGGNYVGYGFSASYATSEFVSVSLWAEFCGASCHVGITPVNYDLKAGSPIKDLAELFRPRTKYLEAIASYSVSELKKSGWDDKDEWFEKGAAPKADNYGLWGLSRNGVEITFPQYQLGPGAAGGARVVVPYSHLKEMLRQDIEWFRRLQLK